MKIFHILGAVLSKRRPGPYILTEKMIRQAGGLPMSRELYERITNSKIDDNSNMICFNTESMLELRKGTINSEEDTKNEKYE